jgi:hypothetical protein
MLRGHLRGCRALQMLWSLIILMLLLLLLLQRVPQPHILVVHVLKKQIVLETGWTAHHTGIFFIVAGGATPVIDHDACRVEGLCGPHKHVALCLASQTHLLLHTRAVVVLQPQILRPLFQIFG